MATQSNGAAATDPHTLAARLCAFVALHQAALEAHEARHNLILGILHAVAADPRPLRMWTLGAPGACAVQIPGRPIVLGELDASACRSLAREAADYSGVVGPESTAQWFVEAARERGVVFGEPMPQMIHAMTEQPVHPCACGEARLAASTDMPDLVGWAIAFRREAVPHDPPPDPARLAQAVAEARYLLWCVDGLPVSMAAIGRRSRHAAAIAPVYTPPALRGRGYAGSAVAALVERIFQQGAQIACLYTDLRNPYSNRCYAKIGFKPVCTAWHYPRIDR